MARHLRVCTEVFCCNFYFTCYVQLVSFPLSSASKMDRPPLNPNTAVRFTVRVDDDDDDSNSKEI